MSNVKSKEMLKVGDVLIAEHFCGFPDNTTKGKEYEVCKVEQIGERINFYIIDDNGKERFPISTTFKKKESIEWQRTDDLQWVKEIDENNFTVLETVGLNESYTLHEIYVDLTDYSDEELEEEVSSYYNSLSQVKETYLENWKQIVAECIAEQIASRSCDNNGEFDSTESLYKHLKEEYNISIEL